MKIIPNIQLNKIGTYFLDFSTTQTILEVHLSLNKLKNIFSLKKNILINISQFTSKLANQIYQFINLKVGDPKINKEFLLNEWNNYLSQIRTMPRFIPYLEEIDRVCCLIENSGAPNWANKIRSFPIINETLDHYIPNNWSEIWRKQRIRNHLKNIDANHNINKLCIERKKLQIQLENLYEIIVQKQSWLKLAENATPSIRTALNAFVSSLMKIGKGTGKRAYRHRSTAKKASFKAIPAIPCWIMPHYRISQTLPSDYGCFDLIIIDEASQSDLSALPAILRSKNILIVGDDKQVSPEGEGIEEIKIRQLMNRYLACQVEEYMPFMSPDRSIYDLLKVVFTNSSIMLKEHFRCVTPIIEYSKREFYNHELRPLRTPHASERIDPPLVDVFVQDGYRQDNLNHPEIHFIVNEIKKIVNDPKMDNRSIGIVSLLGNQQALEIWKALENEIGLNTIKKHQIVCGDASAFQGKERDIMFLTMIVCPNDTRAISGKRYEQRFNVATSRARDRMYLVRSVDIENLSEKDYLRRSLINHFKTPFGQDEIRVKNMRELCESPFEEEIYDLLTERGYRVIPQVKVGHYRIDLVVEDNNDNRLAIECDGDLYHGPDKWDDDMRRQRILERAGWDFWRCFASTFTLNKKETVNDLLNTIKEHGIEIIENEEKNISSFVEYRLYNAFPLKEDTSSEINSLKNRRKQ